MLRQGQKSRSGGRPRKLVAPELVSGSSSFSPSSQYQVNLKRLDVTAQGGILATVYACNRKLSLKLVRNM